MSVTRGLAVLAVVVVLASAFLANAAAAAPARAGARVYANDRLWASFGTAEFEAAPGVSVDRIYVFAEDLGLVPVAEASPGDPDYSGGRWEVHMVTFTGMAPEQFTNDEALWYHASLGHLEIGGPLKYFECPLLRL